MADRSLQRITRDLTRMRQISDVRPRRPDEPFRRYFTTVATQWIAQHGHDHPDLTASLQRFLAREAKRHKPREPNPLTPDRDVRPGRGPSQGARGSAQVITHPRPS